jgi:hypothetical protein
MDVRSHPLQQRLPVRRTARLIRKYPVRRLVMPNQRMPAQLHPVRLRKSGDLIGFLKRIDGFRRMNAFEFPSSLGNWPTRDALLQKELLYEQKVTHLGFAIPKEKGKYKLKFLLSKLDNFNNIENPNLYYVHVEEKLGKDLSWVSKALIKNEE